MATRAASRAGALALALFTTLTAATPAYTPVLPTTLLAFPRDHGAHPGFRTEWWYITGWLQTPDGKPQGFQITFFRTRPPTNSANPSNFAPNQILFAHAALSDPDVGHLLHDQRIARTGFGLAETSTRTTAITLDDWTLDRAATGTLKAHIPSKDFGFDFTLAPSQPELLQGRNGYSQKGPAPSQASHYYSLPQLKLTGTLTRNGKPVPVTGTAWLDREWSSTYLDPRAIGWDWLGLNMDDGSALTLFQIRKKDGTALWAGGSHRSSTGQKTILTPQDVTFTPGRLWHSKATNTRYPVAPMVTVTLRGKPVKLQISPLMNNQELDSRRGGGPVYWEGAVTVPGGKGYLELTGYQSPLKM